MKIIIAGLGLVLGGWLMSMLVGALGINGGGNLAGLMMVAGMGIGGGAGLYIEKTFFAKKATK